MILQELTGCLHYAGVKFSWVEHHLTSETRNCGAHSKTMNKVYSRMSGFVSLLTMLFQTNLKLIRSTPDGADNLCRRKIPNSALKVVGLPQLRHCGKAYRPWWKPSTEIYIV